MAADTIVHRLFEQARLRPHGPAYREKIEGRWKATTWREYAESVRRAASALIALGFERGDTVAILGFNRPEWVIADLAAMAAGGAPAGIYTTSSPSEVQYIVNHAESKFIVLENGHQWGKVEKELARLPHLKYVVTMRGAPKIDHPKVLSWDAFLAKGDDIDAERLKQRMDALEPGGLATLIYTSGTTGPPKGVMLSHENLAWTAKFAVSITAGTPADESLSYLPLSHIAEQVFTIHGPITMGSTVYYAEGIDKVADNLKEVQPTIFFGVPRIWEKFHAGIRQKLGEAPKPRQKIAELAMKVGHAYNADVNAGRRPPPHVKIAHEAFDKLVYSKLKHAIGLSRARIAVSGAAPISAEILEFFSGLDIVVREVYGQSEDTGPTSFNQPGRTKLGSVGPSLPGIDVKIADDGEILIKGPNVFLGYYKDPAATAEALVDGWLHSGDLGKFDEEGYLHITGRKKDIIITAGGKNIAPKNIEGALKNHPLIGEVVVIGDRRKYLTALIALDPEATTRFQQERGLSGPPHLSAEIRSEIQKAVDHVNQDLAQVETVKKFHVVEKPFSIETGELTPTLKVKRNVVQKIHAAEIDALYADARE